MRVEDKKGPRANRLDAYYLTQLAAELPVGARHYKSHGIVVVIATVHTVRRTYRVHTACSTSVLRTMYVLNASSYTSTTRRIYLSTAYFGLLYGVPRTSSDFINLIPVGRYATA